MAQEISNSDDVIDSRDVIQRIAELESEISAVGDEENPIADETATCGECGKSWNNATNPTPAARCPFEYVHAEIAELKTLQALASKAEGYSDWKYGATLIRDSYFEEYAQELAEDIGATDKEQRWPLNHIDWNAAAEELQGDYTSVEFDGVTYWIR